MCYKKANEVLPKEIIELLQTFIEGEYIYIPKKKSNRQKWSSSTNTRKEISIRDSHIYSDYVSGTSRNELAEKYFLSKKSIDRIILKEKSR